MNQNIKNFIEEGEKEFNQLAVYTNEYGYIHTIPKFTEILNWHSSRQISLIKMIVDEADRLKTIYQLTHRIGSHSDDYGGDSDYPCDCDKDKRKGAIEALDTISSSLKELYDSNYKN